VFLFLLTSQQGKAQQFNFKKFSIEEGLPRSGVYSICEDHNGFLWIGTEGGGVARFDGEHFTQFSKEDGLTSNTIRAVYEDDKGRIWLGTQGFGVNILQNGAVKVIDEKDGLPDNTVRAIVQDNEGYIWLGTFGGGIYRIPSDAKNIEQQISILTEEDGLLNNRIRCLLKDSKGQIWVGTDGGVSMYNGKTFVNHSRKNGLPSERILDLFEDGNGNMWFGTKEGAVKFDGKEYTVFTIEDGLIQNRIRAITQDKYGNMWFGTRKGLSRYDGNRFQNFTEAQGLSNERVRTLGMDSQGNLWVGTFFGGINRFSNSQFVHYTNQNGLSNNQVFSFSSRSNTTLWVSTFEGVNCLKLDKFGGIKSVAAYTEDDGLLDNEVHVVYEDRAGNVWMATSEGLNIASNGSIHQLSLHTLDADPAVNFIHEEDSNTFWLGTNEGLIHLKFEGTQRKLYKEMDYTPVDGIAGLQATSFVKKRDGSLWFGFQDGAVSKLENGHFVDLDLPKELNNVMCMATDKHDNLWIGTEGKGIYKYTNNIALHLSTEDSLSSNNINLLCFDDLGNLWSGSEKGIDCLIFRADGTYKECRHYGSEEGFIGIETNQNAVLKTPNGKIWFGTIKGATSFDPYSESHKKAEAFTHITDLLVFGETIEWKFSDYAKGVEGDFDLPHNLVLPYDNNQLTFRFIGISLGVPTKVRYRWRLLPFDDHWSKSADLNEFTYTNLPQGNYTFEVMASNGDGVWNKKPTSFQFIIEPPFWKTSWFLIVAAILGTLIFTGISQLRVRRLRKTKEKLESQVNERTQELTIEKEQVELKNEEIEDKNKEITDSINYARRIQHAMMAPTGEEFTQLQERMCVFYRPKDIVSGDFYWFARSENHTLIAAADCTGHGVPGAFMSMIGIAFLNELVNKKHLTSPGAILNDLRTNVLHSLESEGQTAKDGMDIALIDINWESMQVRYAGAHNPMYIIRKSSNPEPEAQNYNKKYTHEEYPDYSLFEVKADKMPIGIHDYQSKPFTTHTLQLQEGDTIYLFSDGFVDQFGGPKGKKFMAKRMRNMLLSMQNLDLKAQEKALESAFDEWMGVQEQIDDILVLGIRVGQPHQTQPSS